VSDQQEASIGKHLPDQPTYIPNTKQAPQGVHLTFQTLSVLLHYNNGYNAIPAVHVTLAFLWCISFHRCFMESLEARVPWRAITIFLNSMITPNAAFSKIEENPFSVADEGATPQLPEDFLIRAKLGVNHIILPTFSKKDQGTAFRSMRRE
jgi:hypothetical protein